MKHSQKEALSVVNMFERYLKISINIRNYSTREFHHVFEISPIIVNGINKNQIHFKDTLIDECFDMQGNIPDVESYVNSCFS
jgi:hypothetical protein